MDRSQQRLWLDLGQVPKVVFQHALLDGHLGSRVEVLHLATTASPLVQTEVRAAGRHTLRGLAVNVCDGALFPAVFLSADLDLDQLTRQCAFNENYLAIGTAGDALGIHVQRTHAQPPLRQLLLFVQFFQGKSVEDVGGV